MAIRNGARGGGRSVAWRTALALAGALALGGCGMVMAMVHGVERPAAEEFGFGPRSSGSGLYRATLAPNEPIRTGKMQGMKLELRDADNRPVEGAVIHVDGGMPQHGHGLPTRPRVTGYAGDGVYEVGGMKFNMGGWWVLSFRFETAAGADSVIFNLDL
jgi:hypothetical protein